MTKLLSNLMRVLILSVILLTAYQSNAQMHCRSILGGHLSPFHKDVPLLWAVEGTMAPGVMTLAGSEEPAKLNGGMLIGALNYSFLDYHSLYVEGGFKNWENSELSQNLKKSRHIGVRQIFYQYDKPDFTLTLGLQEMKLANYYLIDERVIGARVEQNFNAWTVNAMTGTVNSNFARMGKFCSNRHLYNLIDEGYTENIGDKLGETNMAGIVLNWNPSYEKPTESTGEFDEFSSFDDGGDDVVAGLSNIGILYYNEFGKIIPDVKHYFGSIQDWDLPWNFKAQTGLVGQAMPSNNALVYHARLGRNINWKKGSMTAIEAGYIGLFEIDDDAVFQPLFSNLFLGEIMRLDAADFPLWTGEIKHRFPGKIALHTAVKAVGQTSGNNTNEIDIEVGAKLFNHSKITAIMSRVQTDALPDDVFMARLEVKVAF
ncbi:MAG: hypothetical protein U9N51_02075 [Bacteroidota bacterium]|nr:hypothetical protein [Bacteroidota bacterium]